MLSLTSQIDKEPLLSSKPPFVRVSVQRLSLTGHTGLPSKAGHACITSWYMPGSQLHQLAEQGKELDLMQGAHPTVTAETCVCKQRIADDIAQTSCADA